MANFHVRSGIVGRIGASSWTITSIASNFHNRSCCHCNDWRAIGQRKIDLITIIVRSSAVALAYLVRLTRAKRQSKHQIASYLSWFWRTLSQRISSEDKQSERADY